MALSAGISLSVFPLLICGITLIFFLRLKTYTSVEHVLTCIQSGHIETFQGELRNEVKHIPKMFHGGELPISAVTAVADYPGYEGRWQTRPKDDIGKSCAHFESLLSEINPGMRE